MREKLPADDQALLVLRVDRKMAWRDLAIVMSTGGYLPADSIDEDALARETARLRKRFERVKSELKRLAKEAGLL